MYISRVTTKFKIGKKSGKSREFDLQAKSREKVVNFVESLEKVVNFGQIVKLIFFGTKIGKKLHRNRKKDDRSLIQIYLDLHHFICCFQNFPGD